MNPNKINHYQSQQGTIWSVPRDTIDIKKICVNFFEQENDPTNHTWSHTKSRLNYLNMVIKYLLEIN